MVLFYHFILSDTGTVKMHSGRFEIGHVTRRSTQQVTVETFRHMSRDQVQNNCQTFFNAFDK